MDLPVSATLTPCGLLWNLDCQISMTEFVSNCQNIDGQLCCGQNFASLRNTIYSGRGCPVFPLWDSKISCHLAIRKGEALSEILLKHDLFCLNIPSNVYIFESSRGVSDIDVTGVNVAANSVAPS